MKTYKFRIDIFYAEGNTDYVLTKFDPENTLDFEYLESFDRLADAEKQKARIEQTIKSENEKEKLIRR